MPRRTLVTPLDIMAFVEDTLWSLEVCLEVYNYCNLPNYCSAAS